MPETSDAVVAVQQTRRRALIIPREHGAWGLLLVPLLTGVAAGFAPEHRAWQLLVFTVDALCLLCFVTPVENLIGTGPMTRARQQNDGRHSLPRSFLVL
jgi:YwiC-like protein